MIHQVASEMQIAAATHRMVAVPYLNFSSQRIHRHFMASCICGVARASGDTPYVLTEVAFSAALMVARAGSTSDQIGL